MKEETIKILVAVDGSTCSDAALDMIAQRPWPTGSEVTVVTAVNMWPAVGGELGALSPPYSDDMAKLVRDGAEKIASVARRRLGDCDRLVVTTEFLMGSPTSTVVEEAARWKADLIVVGSHGYGAVKRFFLGSVTFSIVAHAPCSVEIVRSSASPGVE